MTDKNSPPAFTQLIDLAAARLGGKVLSTSDDFFAEKENLIQPGRGVFIPDKYTDRGKWMDGWESRRRRTPGHDWCILQLAVPGKIAGFDIDTNHFLGNHPPFASIEAVRVEGEFRQEGELEWTEILPKVPLEPGSQHLYDCPSEEVWTHLRFKIYPDGGVARLRVYGEVWKNWAAVGEETIVDLVAAVNGGRAEACNDMFFSNMNNLIMPGRGRNMGDGWETKRCRIPNNCDWVVLRLGHLGRIRKVLVDTHHFKGNFPDQCSLEGCRCSAEDNVEEVQNWVPLLPRMKLQAHQEHYFEKEIMSNEAFTHVRFNIFPDGGISRLRLFGTIE